MNNVYFFWDKVLLEELNFPLAAGECRTYTWSRAPLVHIFARRSPDCTALHYNMQNRTEKLGARLRHRGPRSSTTYLAKVAVVLQEAPGKMFTFSQLMNKLALCSLEDKKSFENNIRVCLSTHKCFVKVPMVLGVEDSKRNYWKLDCTQITAKMVRRHFKGLLHLFPELAAKVETENVSRPSQPCSAVLSPDAAACGAVQTRRVKFSGPFSIESLLRRENPSSAQTFRDSPLSNLQVGAEQQPGRFLICPTGGSRLQGLAVDGAAAHSNGLRGCAEALFPGYATASAAPYISTPHSSYITYSVPVLTHDALRL